MAFSNKHLLLVEDSPTDAVLLERFLAKSDCQCQVKHVATLAAACDALAEASFDLVVLDLNLPDSVSLPTLHAIRCHFTDVPIVVLSGEFDKNLAEQAYALGVSAYFNKNADALVDIAAGIRQTLANSE